MPSLEPYDKRLDYSYCLGAYPCSLLLKNRPESALRLLLSDAAGGEGVDALRERCRQLNIREEIAPRILKRESGKQNCFVALVFRKYQSELDAKKPHAVFHRISDGGNLGTALRSAAGFGYSDIAVIRPCVDVFDPHVLRSSMGAYFLGRVRVYDAFEEYARDFAGRPMYPFMLDGARDLDEVAGDAPAVHSLIFGNEAAGLDASFQEFGQSVKIKQSDAIDSLNLAVAASIAMYTFSRHSGQATGNQRTGETEK